MHRRFIEIVVRFLSLICFVFFSASTWGTTATELLSCEVLDEEGVSLRLAEQNGQLVYTLSSGQNKASQVEFLTPANKVVYRFWDNAGQYKSYLVVLRRNDYVYTVYASYDSWSGLDANGVTVEHNEVFEADHKCHPVKVKSNLMAYVTKNLSR